MHLQSLFECRMPTPTKAAQGLKVREHVPEHPLNSKAARLLNVHKAQAGRSRHNHPTLTLTFPRIAWGGSSLAVVAGHATVDRVVRIVWAPPRSRLRQAGA